MDIVTAVRYHDISCGHRVVGHEGKCRHLHGHNYRMHFEIRAAELDKVGRVLDFGVIKEKLCLWLEEHWDHKMLLWDEDHVYDELPYFEDAGVVEVPFNPTAENMAAYLLTVIGPQQLQGTGCTLIRVTVDETRKCSAEARL